MLKDAQHISCQIIRVGCFRSSVAEQSTGIPIESDLSNESLAQIVWVGSFKRISCTTRLSRIFQMNPLHNSFESDLSNESVAQLVWVGSFKWIRCTTRLSRIFQTNQLHNSFESDLSNESVAQIVWVRSFHPIGKRLLRDFENAQSDLFIRGREKTGQQSSTESSIFSFG